MAFLNQCFLGKFAFDLINRCSDVCLFFFSRYMANTETYLKNVALKHMPPNLQKVSLLKSGEYSQTLG